MSKTINQMANKYTNNCAQKEVPNRGTTIPRINANKYGSWTSNKSSSHHLLFGRYTSEHRGIQGCNIFNQDKQQDS